MNSTNTTACNLTIEEYCDYDYEATYSVPVEELVPVAIVYGFTMIFGVIGNTLVIVSVARFKKMQNVTNMFLLSLASADLLLVLICVPVKVYYCCVVQHKRLWKYVLQLSYSVIRMQNCLCMFTFKCLMNKVDPYASYCPEATLFHGALVIKSTICKTYIAN